MYRLNEVVHHWIYQDYYGRIKRLEKERIFCCHQMTHLLDVARIAYIKNLEENLGFEKDVIYTAAVLHDIGKSFQYKWTIPHEVAGEKIAKEILTTLPEDAQFRNSSRFFWLSVVIAENMREWNRLRNCFMIVINARVCAIPVRHRNSVTGRKKRRIWR